MNRNSSPGLGQWITVSFMVAVSFFLLYKLYQYSTTRSYLPTGLTIGGVDVGRMTEEEATELLTSRYIEAPVTLIHGENQFEVMPAQIEFTLDMDKMLLEADIQRSSQDFWSGFWGFLWGRPVQVQPIELASSLNREALRNVLQEIKEVVDVPAQPAQPVPGSMSFQYGTAGTETDIEGSFDDVEAAFHRPNLREATLTARPKSPERPNINLLSRLLVNRLQVFEQETGGLAGIFILDLNTGEEININGSEPVSAIDLMKIPIVLETYRALDQLPTLTQRQLISDTLVVNPENASANSLLAEIGGETVDPYVGAERVTATMQRLGLVNTFIMAPYDAGMPAGKKTPETPANSVEVLRTNPSPTMQTTAEDVGTLLSMIYYCATGQGGALVAAFPDNDWQRECLEILDFMGQNKIGSLLEEGVPAEITVAHRHGWIGDTNVDAGIVFSPGGDYVIVEILYKPEWLEWELSAPLMADVSRAAYNYFNFDNPYLGESSAANN
ncbi:serine hydrolase [Promineifilum sp.]|uniref:serine hydrolase n=1 Tax=Promineifilum sp. TaxID=2664178 RepID=UPI0035B1F463